MGTDFTTWLGMCGSGAGIGTLHTLVIMILGGAVIGRNRVLRGGDWGNNANGARNAYRSTVASIAIMDYGFRLVRGRLPSDKGSSR
jgi:hypothetical protein